MPIQLEMEEKEDVDLDEDVDMYAEHMHKLKKSIYEKAMTNIENAQQYQKRAYEKRHCKKEVCYYI